MKITSAKFIRGVRGTDDVLYDGRPQVAFIGRSNAGKSTLINTLTGVKNLARWSKTPGRTQELNVFFVNDSFYFIDFPGYGYVKTSFEAWQKVNKLIDWYLFRSGLNPKIVMIIDGNIGPTENDLGVLRYLENEDKDVIIVANKIDKVKKSKLKHRLKLIKEKVPGHIVVPFSSKTKTGIGELSSLVLKK